MVPGADTEELTSGLAISGSNNPVSTSSKIGSRPKHKRQDQVQQLSYNHSRLEFHFMISRVFFIYFLLRNRKVTKSGN